MTAGRLDADAVRAVLDGMRARLVERGFSSLSQAIGFAHRPADVVPAVEDEGDDYDFITE